MNLKVDLDYNSTILLTLRSTLPLPSHDLYDYHEKIQIKRLTIHWSRQKIREII